jgi:putative membrane protein
VSAPPHEAVAEAPPVDVGRWHRLHPLSPLVRVGRAVVPLLVVVFIPFGGRNQQSPWWHVAVVGLFVLGGVVSWLVTRWRVEDGSLRVESGLFRRDSQRMPLARVQAVDIVRPGLARMLGLAEVRLRTAGDSGDAGRLAYLRLAEAERVRAQLLAIAHGVSADAPAPPEWPLYVQRGDRLVGSVALSRPFGVLVLFAAAVVVLEFLAPAVAGSVLGASFAYVLAVATVVWRRFNAGFGLRVAEAADGLRLRAGALETRAETIPRGRVQALVRTEPLFWRPAGWVRQQIDVAGQAKSREERQAGTRQLRDVVPAGTAVEADLLLERLLPDRPAELVPPPARARWKSPLRYHWLRLGWNDVAIIVTSGRVTRRTVWIPLAKVQSLRLRQGPVQRRLGLTTLEVDAAGKRVAARAHDRDAGEAEALLLHLAEACRRARG